MVVTLKDIAKMCGVSATTASLVLNDKPVRVSAEKKQMIQEVAKSHSYKPNSLAVGLVTKRTKTIGLLVPDISNMFFSQMAKKLESNFSQLGYSLFLCNTDDNNNLQDKYIKLLYQRGVDAIVICVANDQSSDDNSLKDLKDMNIPIVAFDRYSPELNCPLVIGDNTGSSCVVVNQLIKLGHTRIACITGPVTKAYSSRLEGYKQALAQNNIAYDEEIVLQGDYRFESGYACAKKLLEKNPTAIFVCNDMMAYGAYKAIEEAGLRIPQDVSVVGFDDLMFSTMLSVPLTTVRQDIDGMCDKITEITYDMINGKQHQGVSIFSSTVNYRDSIGKAK